MLKKRPLLAALLFAPFAALIIYYTLIPIIGPYLTEVCRKGDYGPPDYCEQHDVITSALIWILWRVDEHNGIVAALAGISVAVFTFALWDSTEKMWRHAINSVRETRIGERAWVNVGGTETNFNIDGAGARTALVQVRWRNTGRTPGINLRTSLWGVDAQPHWDEVSGITVIGPGSDVLTAPFVIDLREAFETDAVYRFNCAVRYLDIFEGKVRSSEVVIDVSYVSHRDPYSFDVTKPGVADDMRRGVQIQTISQTAT